MNDAPTRRVNGLPILLALAITLNVILLVLLFADGNDESPSEIADAEPVVSQPESAASDASEEPPVVTVAPQAVVPATDDGPTRLLVVGDSVGTQIGWGLQLWSEANPGEIIVMNEAHLGCGVVRYGQKRVDGESGPVGDICSNWNEPVALHEAADPEVVSWPSIIELFEPDVVLSVVSSWDITDRIVPGVVDDWSSVGDPRYEGYLRGEYTTATAVLAESGADVYWLMSATLHKDLLPDDHFFRVGGINTLVGEAIAAVEADQPDAAITQLDYQSWLGETGAERDRALREDGVHLSEFGQAEIAPWLLGEMGLS